MGSNRYYFTKTRLLMISATLRARSTLATKGSLIRPSFACFSNAGKPLVTITGLDGFVGPHVGLEFLNTGNYRVRATVRPGANQDKMDAIKKAYGSKYGEMEVVEAELLNADSMLKAIEGSDYVAHLASP